MQFFNECELCICELRRMLLLFLCTKRKIIRLMKTSYNITLAVCTLKDVCLIFVERIEKVTAKFGKCSIVSYQGEVYRPEV